MNCQIQMCQSSIDTTFWLQVWSKPYWHYLLASGGVQILPTLSVGFRWGPNSTNIICWLQVGSKLCWHYLLASGVVRTLLTLSVGFRWSPNSTDIICWLQVGSELYQHYLLASGGVQTLLTLSVGFRCGQNWNIVPVTRRFPQLKAPGDRCLIQVTFSFHIMWGR